jgi:membrane peptidoglycan carboxypeptidase
MGYTPSIAVGVWAGNNDNSIMKPGAAGANVAAPIWRSFLDQVLQNYNKEDFPKYDKDKALEGVEKDILKGDLDFDKKEEVCEIPGEDDEWCKANKYCPEDDWDKKIFVNAHNILWYVDKDNPQGEKPNNPDKDPQFDRWEEALEDWYKDEDKDYILGEAPEDDCDKDDFEEFLPSVDISASKSGPAIKINASADAPYGVDSLKIYVDGKEVASTSSSSISTTYDIPSDKMGSSFKVEAKLVDENGNNDSDSENVST